MNSDKTKGSYKSFSTILTATGNRWALWRCWNCLTRALTISGCTFNDYRFSGWFNDAEFKVTLAGYDEQLVLVKAVLEGWREADCQAYSLPVEVPLDPSAPQGPLVTHADVLKAAEGNFALHRCWVCLSLLLKTSGCVLKTCEYTGWETDATLSYTIVGSQTQIDQARAVVDGWRTKP